MANRTLLFEHQCAYHAKRQDTPYYNLSPLSAMLTSKWKKVVFAPRFFRLLLLLVCCFAFALWLIDLRCVHAKVRNAFPGALPLSLSLTRPRTSESTTIHQITPGGFCGLPLWRTQRIFSVSVAAVISYRQRQRWRPLRLGLLGAISA